MIRIDEIYYNVFVSALQGRTDVICHWFDPFGSVNFDDLKTFPNTKWPRRVSKRLIFWDQEPLTLEFTFKFLQKFEDLYCYEPAERRIITSEIENDEIKWLKDNFGYKIDYYFFHGWAALDWYRGYNHSFLSQPWMDRTFQYSFICPNNIVGGHRRHRLHFLIELYKRNCLEENLVSFPAICPYEKRSTKELVEEENLLFPDDLILPLIIDHHSDHANNSHCINFWPESMKSFCHVITETVYDKNRLQITEKTFKPIVLQQPFLMVGGKGSLAYLRKYGFQTFNELWDESYDNLSDEHRLVAVADICQDITSWSDDKMRAAQNQIAAVVKHNHDWFYGGFQDILWKELCDMVEKWK